MNTRDQSEVIWQDTAAPKKPRRVKKEVLCKWYFGLNRMKALIFTMHCENSTGEWEKNLYDWLVDKWTSGEEPL